jgi:hypothetical protein
MQAGGRGFLLQQGKSRGAETIAGHSERKGYSRNDLICRSDAMCFAPYSEGREPTARRVGCAARDSEPVKRPAFLS